jgi:hypothetical protein
MRARRIRFAAPFVIVTAASCGQPAPATLPTASPVAATSADAGVPLVDATPIDAEPAAIYVTVAIPAHTVEPKGYISCHNFGPHNRGCNPPRPQHYDAKEVMRKVLDASANGDGSLVLVEQTDHADIEAGMSVTAQTMAMKERMRVGRVREASDRTATLDLRLSLEDVQNGADLVIDVTFDPDEAVIDSLDARIVDVQPRDDGGSLLTIAAGRTKGVDKGWRLEVIGATKGGHGIITVVTTQASRAVVKMTPDEVKQSRGLVRLTPPDR